MWLIYKVDSSWQIEKLLSWHWGLVADCQRVSWTVLAILAMFLYELIFSAVLSRLLSFLILFCLNLGLIACPSTLRPMHPSKVRGGSWDHCHLMAAVNYINSFQISPLTAAALYLLVFYIKQRPPTITTHSTLSLQHYVHTIKYGMLETRTASLQKCQTPAHDAQSVQVWKIVACLCSPVPSHFAQSLCLTLYLS